MSKSRRLQKDIGQASPPGNAADGISNRFAESVAKRLWSFAAQFREANDPDKVFRSALRLGCSAFGAIDGCVVSIPPGRDEATVLLREPRNSLWSTELLVGFLRGRKIPVPHDTLLARIRRHDRMWGAIAVRRTGADYRWESRQEFSSIGCVVSQLINDMDLARVREVRNRIDRKLLEQIRPKNLFYEILHSLRSLTGYDHSAALLMCLDDGQSLEIVAEQISSAKAKSRLVGSKRELSTEQSVLLSQGTTVGFDRTATGWRSWSGVAASPVGEMLDFYGNPADSSPLVPENAILCAPLSTRDGLLGVLKVAAVHPGTFGPYEAELVNQFLPQAALALHGLKRTQSLELQVLAAERKHAMADLARGVAHDINNALGGVLPLVQQLRVDLERGEFYPELVSGDLQEIERSLQLCRRVFGGMLKFARSLTRNASEIYLHDAVESTVAIIKDRLERRGIRVELDVPTSLPPLRGVAADIEQLLLNLVNNSAEAVQSGDCLTVKARQEGETVQLFVADTGCGISPENLPRIQEPFFTTKPSGNGLGLAICRSIVSQMGGRIRIESRLGAGTQVSVTFPLPTDDS
jgi:signal transduction histidine kinase